MTIDLIRPADLGTPVPIMAETIIGKLATALRTRREPHKIVRRLATAQASRGEPLQPLLNRIEATYQWELGQPTDSDVAQAALLAWSNETLARVKRLSGQDPLTGLATVHHLNHRLASLYHASREYGPPLSHTHWLVIGELVPALGPSPVSRLTEALQLATVADAARREFPRTELVAHVSLHRVAALTPKESDLAARLDAMVIQVETEFVARGEARRLRVRIEPLPRDKNVAAMLTEGLAHG